MKFNSTLFLNALFLFIKEDIDINIDIDFRRTYNVHLTREQYKLVITPIVL